MFKTATHFFAHKPKTSGTYVREVLGQKYRGKVAGGGHDPAWMIGPHLLDNKVTFGTDRDPASWYGSWWQHAMNNGQRQHQELALYGAGSTEFRDVLYGVTHPLERTIPRRVGVIIRLQSDAEAAWRDIQPLGLWSFMSLYIYGAKGAYHTRTPDWEIDYLVDSSKNTTVGLAEVLGVPESEISDVPRKNTHAQRGACRFTPPPGTYRDWYDDEMLGWVEEADGWLMGLQGRKSPFGVARAPCQSTELMQ